MSMLGTFDTFQKREKETRIFELDILTIFLKLVLSQLNLNSHLHVKCQSKLEKSF